MSDEDDGEAGDGDQDGVLPVRPNRPPADLTPGFDYKAWTTKFDEVIASDEFCAPTSTSSSFTCRGLSPSSPTGCSAA